MNKDVMNDIYRAYRELVSAKNSGNGVESRKRALMNILYNNAGIIVEAISSLDEKDKEIASLKRDVESLEHELEMIDKQVKAQE